MPVCLECSQPDIPSKIFTKKIAKRNSLDRKRCFDFPASESSIKFISLSKNNAHPNVQIKNNVAVSAAKTNKTDVIFFGVIDS